MKQITEYIIIKDLIPDYYLCIPEIRRAETYMTTVFKKCYDY